MTPQEERMKADLERLGIEVTKSWPVGDNAYSPEWTLQYSDPVGHISAIGPTLDMTIAEFVGKLLKARILV